MKLSGWCLTDAFTGRTVGSTSCRNSFWWILTSNIVGASRSATTVVPNSVSWLWCHRRSKHSSQFCGHLFRPRYSIHTYTYQCMFYVCTHVCTCIRMYVCMHACMPGCMYIFMYACPCYLKNPRGSHVFGNPMLHSPLSEHAEVEDCLVVTQVSWRSPGASICGWCSAIHGREKGDWV